jgi:hypothetical protein
MVGPPVYGVFYPQPYLNQIVRKILIAVVDNDLSELSRRIVQTRYVWPARGNRLCRFVALAARRKL